MGGGNPFGGFEFNFGAGGFSDIFENIFSDFMGGGRGQQRSYAQAGADLRYNMEITLEEAFFGVEKEIKIPSTKVCEACHGHGTADGKEPEICPDCHGSGKIRQQQGGFFIVETTCPKCRGKGRIIKEACKECKGAGVIGEEKPSKSKYRPELRIIPGCVSAAAARPACTAAERRLVCFYQRQAA